MKAKVETTRVGNEVERTEVARSRLFEYLNASKIYLAKRDSSFGQKTRELYLEVLDLFKDNPAILGGIRAYNKKYVDEIETRDERELAESLLLKLIN